MAPPSAALASLAADKRAAVELVLRRGLSYGELANLLDVPEETIRERARAGLEALAPDLPPPPRAGEIADWLLGQQAPAHAERTRTLVTADPATRRWTGTVAAPLSELSENVPSLDADLPARRDGAGARPRPLRDAAAPAARDEAPGGQAKAAEAAPPAPPVAGPSAAAAAPGRSSRLGGAILIGLALLVVGGVIAFVLTRDHGSSSPPATAATATPTATATAGANDIVLRGPAGSSAVGLMRLFTASDNTLRFALAAQGIEPNKSGQRYSIWFRKNSGPVQLLGDVKDPVGKAKTLTAAGPGNADTGRFPTWLQTYDTVVVTLDPPKARRPGTVILSGNLPKNQG